LYQKVSREKAKAPLYAGLFLFWLSLFYILYLLVTIYSVLSLGQILKVSYTPSKRST